MQTYIIKCIYHRLLNDEIERLSNGITNIIHYDILDCNINDILNECNYVSLFDKEKVVIVHNMKYFSNKGDYKSENELIGKYLEKENVDTKLIFLVDDINLRNKNVKLIKENNNLIVIDKLDKKDLIDLVKKYITKNNYKIDSKGLELLIDKCINNYDIILNELDKLFLIKTDLFISLNDINKYCSNYLEENFDFINALSTKNKKVLVYLDDMIELKVDPTIIMGQIINQFRLMYIVLVGLNNYSEDYISKSLNIHPYRVKLAKENGFNYGVSNLESILDELTELDLKIKGDYSNKYTLIKKFLLDLLD